VRALSLRAGAAGDRLRRRQQMLTEVAGPRSQAEGPVPPAVQARDAFYERAYSLLTSPAARRAFEIDREPASVRDNYGRNSLGQSCLLARRLVEAGVHFVTVTDGGW